MLRVAVVGAYGRLGTAACAAVAGDSGCELVARVGSADRLDLVTDAGADVAVEVTVPACVRGNTAWLLGQGVHTVVGATGLSDDDLAELERLTGPANLLVAPNFAIGAVLMMRVAEQLARHLPHAEITELHHDRKLDAPSGTARRTARLIADARGEPPATPPGDRGPGRAAARGELSHGVPVHSVRLPGMVASQEVVFGAAGQTLTVRHDTFDRSAFGPGVVLAVKRVGSLPGLTVGLEGLLSGPPELFSS